MTEGNVILAMNEAGFFENSKKSIQILCQGFVEYRQFTEEELSAKDRTNEK